MDSREIGEGEMYRALLSIEVFEQKRHSFAWLYLLGPCKISLELGREVGVVVRKHPKEGPQGG